MPSILQNNQLQELPYNELSRLSDLRTLNLHNNLISSEGEGDNRRPPLLAWSQQPSSSPRWVCGQLCGSSQNCPLLSRMETRDGGALWLLWTGRGTPGGASASPWPGALGSWEHRVPLSLAPARPGVPSPPAPLLGLPDEAFESLTQLQHIYVAHNKVRYPPERHPRPDLAWPASHSTECRGDSTGLEGGCQDQYVVLPQLSVAPQFLPRSLRVADLAANQVTEIFPLTFGEKPALR